MSFIADNYKEYIKKHVSEFIKENGKLPTKKDMENKDVSVAGLVDSCGGWNNGLIALGFGKDSILEAVNVDEEMDKVRNIQNQKGGVVPTLADLKKGKVKINVLLNKYGNWNNIKNLLKGDITEEEALREENIKDIFDEDKAREELIDFIKKYDKIPTMKEAKDKGINVNKLIKKYNTWTKVKEELGLYDVQRELVLEQIKEIQRKEEKVKRPSLAKLKAEKVNIKSLLKKYSTWKKACSELGIELYDVSLLESKVIEIAERMEKTPLESELRAQGINVKPLVEKYDGWYNVVEALELYKYNDQKALNEIQRLVGDIDKTPTKQQLRENHISLTGLFKRYNGWDGVREYMGLPKYSKFTNTQLKESEQQIIAIGNQLGRTPKLEDIIEVNKKAKERNRINKENGVEERVDKIHVSALIHRYGSWNDLLYKLGFKINGKYPDSAIDELLDRVKSLANKLGRTPSIREVKAEGISITPLRRKFGSFGEALESIGLTPRVLSKKAYEANKDAILAQLKDIADELGKMPSMKQAKAKGIKTHGLVKDFGNWTKVKVAIEEMQQGNVQEQSSELRLA